MAVEIFIPKHCDDWPDIDPIIARAVRHTLEMVQYNKKTEISLVLADDDFVQQLNKEYRGKDKPTNVLSFPQEDEHFMNLGDVIFALETIQKEAQEQNKNFEDHLAHLTVHGTLHLLGYDHELDDEADDMEALEIEILSTLNIANPYEDEDTSA